MREPRRPSRELLAGRRRHDAPIADRGVRETNGIIFQSEARLTLIGNGAFKWPRKKRAVDDLVAYPIDR